MCGEGSIARPRCRPRASSQQAKALPLRLAEARASRGSEEEAAAVKARAAERINFAAELVIMYIAMLSLSTSARNIYALAIVLLRSCESGVGIAHHERVLDGTFSACRRCPLLRSGIVVFAAHGQIAEETSMQVKFSRWRP